MSKKGFTLIELLAVIMILAILVLIGATTVLPYMRDARQRAFRVEATNVLRAAQKAYELEQLGKITVDEYPKDWCINSNGEHYYSVDMLRNLGIYENKNVSLVGRVSIVDNGNNNYSYKLWLKKGAEFKIIEGTESEYIDHGTLSTGAWSDDYSIVPINCGEESNS